MTTVLLDEVCRDKLGLVNKWSNYVNNGNDSLGQTIEKLLDEEIKIKKIVLHK